MGSSMTRASTVSIAVRALASGLSTESLHSVTGTLQVAPSRRDSQVGAEIAM